MFSYLLYDLAVSGASVPPPRVDISNGWSIPTMLRSSFYLLLLHVHCCVAHMYVYLEVPDPLEQELAAAMFCHVGVVN